jgi:hypothetical protein
MSDLKRGEKIERIRLAAFTRQRMSASKRRMIVKKLS